MQGKTLLPFETQRRKQLRFSSVVFLCLFSSFGCIIGILAGLLLDNIVALMIGFVLEAVGAISLVVVYILADVVSLDALSK